MSKWQPIETAPKDGTEVLLTRKPEPLLGGRELPPVYIGCWCQSREEWRTSCESSICDGVSYVGQPQFWMPLPEPPKED